MGECEHHLVTPAQTYRPSVYTLGELCATAVAYTKLLLLLVKEPVETNKYRYTAGETSNDY